MRKALFMGGIYRQEIPELEALEQVEEAGTYAVPGFSRPINIQPVTEYGEEQIWAQYPSAVFFTGNDGSRYVAMQTGDFADMEVQE